MAGHAAMVIAARRQERLSIWSFGWRQLRTVWARRVGVLVGSFSVSALSVHG